MNDILEFLKGRKSYIIAIAIAVLGTLQGLGVFVAPDWIWPVLGAFGLGAMRAGIEKVAEATKPK